MIAKSMTCKKSTHSLDPFKRAVISTVRAMAEKPALEVRFETDSGEVSGGDNCLPEMSTAMTQIDIAHVRGLADACALWQRHHDPDLHQKLLPADPGAQRAYTAMEEARVEAIGAIKMPGVAQNLASTLEAYYAKNPTSTAPDPGGIHDTDSALDYDLLKLLVRERLTHAAVPESAIAVMNRFRGSVEARAGLNLDILVDHLENQQAFARLSRKIIEDMGFGEKTADERQNQSKIEEISDPPDVAVEDDDGDIEDYSDSENDNPEEIGPDERSAPTEHQDVDSVDSQTATKKRAREQDYIVFTTEFDQIVRPQDLCVANVLAFQRYKLDQQLRGMHGVITRLANRLQRRLMARQLSSWDFDLEEGILDAGRLTRVVTHPLRALSFKAEQEADFKDTVITLLIDNSGSMRGRPIAVAAICADILARSLERCGVKVEILGFTTRGWKGGESHRKWLQQNQPKNPGRLTDLRHIIYKTADCPWRRARNNLGLMLRESLLKDNIDGESLLWAHSRLLKRTEQRRILLVISDGAPEDHSTTSTNQPDYLESHLRSVIEWIEQHSDVELLAIGIGHDVGRYYQKAVTIKDAEQLGSVIIEQLSALFNG